MKLIEIFIHLPTHTHTHTPEQSGAAQYGLQLRFNQIPPPYLTRTQNTMVVRSKFKEKRFIQESKILLRSLRQMSRMGEGRGRGSAAIGKKSGSTGKALSSLVREEAGT